MTMTVTTAHYRPPLPPPTDGPPTDGPPTDGQGIAPETGQPLATTVRLNRPHALAAPVPSPKRHPSQCTQLAASLAAFVALQASSGRWPGLQPALHPTSCPIRMAADDFRSANAVPEPALHPMPV
jgi:hypothetical protein